MITEKRKFSRKAHLCNFVATGFYSGLSPFAPGTAGSALAFAILFFLYQIAPSAAETSIVLAIATVTTGLGIFVSNKVLTYGMYNEEKDPGPIVVDEFAGFFVAVAGHGLAFSNLLLGFFLFRLFDIIKPSPVRNLEKLPGGYGIVLDDIAAGIYANLALHLLLYFYGNL